MTTSKPWCPETGRPVELSVNGYAVCPRCGRNVAVNAMHVLIRHRMGRP